jgi:hypothetical protein
MRLSRRISRLALASAFVCLLAAVPLDGADSWKESAGELARIIAAQIGAPTTVALTMRNASTLTESDAGAIRQALRSQLRSQGFRFVRADRAKAEVRVTLSENADGYLWVAEIGSGDSRAVRMVAVPRVPPPPASSTPEPLSIRKALVFEQEERILDFSLLGPDAEGTARMLLLGPERISLFKKLAGSWAVQQTAPISHARPWPRDLRGRLVVRTDQTFDVYLPGVKCAGAVQPELSADCHEGSETWPLDAGSSSEVSARLAADRNSFERRAAIGSAQEMPVPPFYSAAEIPGRGGPTWVFAGVDGHVRLIEKGAEPVATWEGWGSNIASLRSGCGKGWQLLATRPGDGTEPDAVQAFEVSGRRAVPVSAPVEFPGAVVEMWPAADGVAVKAISRNLKTGNYEAFSLSISCGE